MAKNRQEIVNEIISETTKSVPEIKNYRVGGVFRTFIEVVASFLEKIYRELEELLPNRFLTTAKGKWLDLKAEELSLKRFLATKTRGYVVFSRADASRSLTILKDKILATKNGLRYRVVADVELSTGETARSVLVEAEELGARYNVIGGQIIEMITPISGIDTITNANDWIVEVGKDTETDESLRSRCLALWLGLSGANKSAYISWTKSVEGVGDVRVISTVRGLGTVDVVFTGINNVQPSAELIEKVQSAIDERKPISTNTLVKAPNEVLIDTNITVQMLPNFALNQDNIKNAVRMYFESLGIGSDFEPSKLSSVIFNVDGVKSVKINSPTSQRISELQIARMGTTIVELSNASEV